MNMQETLKAIKALFQDQPLPTDPAPAPVEPVAPVEMKEYTLADGTAVMIDKLEIGGMVKVGELPAPEGEHKLADGSSITVDAAGIITEIEAAEPVEPPAPEPAPAPVAMRDERVDALIAENKQIKQGFAQLVALVEALAAEPAAEPLEPSRDKFSAQREAKAEKFKQLQEVLKKHKQ
jgi:hypothetical protein